MKRTTLLTLALTAALAANSAIAADAPEAAATPDALAQASSIDAVLAGHWRSAENKARDPYRHPKQTLAFFDISPGQAVVELVPGGGWYSEILAPYLKDSGRYVAAIIKPQNSSDEAANYKSRLLKKFTEDPAHYAKAQVIEFDGQAPVFGPPASADAVLTFRNVHNWIGNGSAEAMFKAMFAVLKPGGTLGVVDHRAKPGSTLAQNKDSGYLPVDAVIKLATGAGFTLAAQSEVNANPQDTKDYPKGVWTLPPALALKEVDRDKYLAIGESDRMTLKFVKPR